MSDELAVSGKEVKKALLGRAIRALKQVTAKKSANANPLFGENAETMTLLFTLSQIPEKRKMKPFMIALPHPMYDANSEVCFLSKDPQKEFKDLLIRERKVPGITKVIGLDKLRRNYKTFESKRMLADAYDLFLCDVSIVEMMPKTLGSVFYQKKKKIPIPVKLRPEEPMLGLDRAIGATTLRMPAGPCVGVKIGRCSASEEHLLANAVTVISTVMKRMKENPVMNISLQATDSVALPVWKRPRPPGEAIDLKKWHSDASSSAASDAGALSGASETEGTAASETVSDAGETLSTRDSISELETGGETMSEMESTELDSEAGDRDEAPPEKGELPLLKGIGKKRRRQAEAGAAVAAEAKGPAAKKGRGRGRGR
mmetsp:Transcript_4509/g.10498  ORF Transcript_4509/g.10498 Transcript_4509/m.10498 type:complete len:372 (-) Transcript_4509:117-1232(-)